MIVLSFERLGAVNRQPNLSGSIRWLNTQLLNHIPVYQSLSEVRVTTERFPEGHIYPAGTLFVDVDTDVVPSDLYIDKADDVAECLAVCRKLSLPKRMGVYNGLNCAPFCFDPYQNMFREYGFPYVELKDEDIRAGALRDCNVLVVPGGPDAGESYYAGLGDKGLQEVRDFIARGGGYIGSCAGAYLPLTGRAGSPEQRMWLNIVPMTDPAGLDYWRTGTGFVRISLHASSQSPVLYGLAYGEPSTVDVIYWEGPAFHGVNEQTRVLATYQQLVGTGSESRNWQVTENSCASDALVWSNPLTRERFDAYLKDMPAAIEARYGHGRLILFSFHPEFGHPAYPWASNPVHLFVINAVYDLSS